MNVNAKKGYCFVVTEDGYSFSVNCNQKLKEERAVGRPIKRYEFSVPDTWLENGWVREAEIKFGPKRKPSKVKNLGVSIYSDECWWLEDVDKNMCAKTKYHRECMVKDDVIPRVLQDDKELQWVILGGD